MRCLSCKADDGVVTKVSISLNVRLAKGGGIDLAGVSVTQKDLKEAYEADLRAVDGTDETYHPAHCCECGAEFRYVMGKGLQPVGEATEGQNEVVKTKPSTVTPPPAAKKVIKAPVTVVAKKKLVLKK